MSKAKEAAAAKKEKVEAPPLNPSIFIDNMWDLLPSIIAAKNVSSSRGAAGAEEGSGVDGNDTNPAEDEKQSSAQNTPRGGAEGQEEATINQIASSEDIQNFIQLIHRAANANILEEESAAVGAKFIEAPVSGDSGVTKEWAVTFIESVVLQEWLGVNTSTASVAEVAATLTDLVRCITTEDPKKMELLPLNDVLTHKSAKKIDVVISDYVSLTKYPTYDPVYDQMWVKLSNGNKTIDEETFAIWFNWFYYAVFDNATKRRADQAARTHFYQTIATTGEFTEDAFRKTASRLVNSYCKHLGTIAIPYCPEAFYQDLMGQSTSTAEGGKEEGRDDNNPSFFENARPKCSKGLTTLKCPVEFHIVDNLDVDKEEMNFFAESTKNRVLVVGKAGVGKTTFGRKLAKALGAVHIDCYELGLQAVRDPNNQFHELTKKEVVRAGEFPHYLQWKMVKAALEDPKTKHCGYVLSDLPSCHTSNANQIDEFFEALQPLVDVPQAIVEITCPTQDYDSWQERSIAVKRAMIAAEMKLREDELQAKEAKERAKREKEEKARLREERAIRREKIAAGEIEATEEDNVEEEEPEEEEQEEEVPVDEDGNPLDEAAIAALQAEKEAKVAQRILETDMYEQYVRSRELDVDLDQFDPMENEVIQRFKDIAEHNDGMISIPCYDSTDEQIKFTCEKLKLAQRTIPTLPDVPADQLEGVDPSTPDGEAAMAEINQRVVTENIDLTPSRWQRYCPVTYFEDKVLFEGSWVYSCVYRSKYYLFASRAKLAAFMANPHPYLLTRVESYTPAALYMDALSTLSDAGVDMQALKEALGARLGLTPLSLEEFSSKWKSHADEVSRRNGIETTRSTKDASVTAAREEKKRKQREAEAKKRKAAEKGKKKKKGEEVVEEEAPAEADQGQGDEGAGEEVPPTVEQQLAEQLAKQKELRASVLPLLVDCTNMSDRLYDQVFDQRVLPELAIIFQCKAPRPEGEEEEEEVQEEEEEEEQPVAEEEEGEEGVEKPPPAPKVIDFSDAKQYAKYLRKTVARMNKSAEDAAAIAEGGAPEAGEEGEPAPLPPQNFSVKTVNLHGLALDDIVTMIIQIIDPVAVLALPPADGDEIITDPPLDEPEEGQEPINPLMIPGKRAAHQYGRTLHYCPWTLREKGALLQGDTSIWGTYNGEKYTFASQQAMDAFNANPVRYMPTVPPAIPAPRVWVQGVPSSGKRTVARAFSATYDIPTFPYSKEAFHAIMDAASSASGGEVEGVQIPSQPENTSLKIALALRKELEDFAAKQIEQAKLKEETQKQQDERERLREEGEEVDELDEDEEAEIAKILEFEPEEEELKVEREGLAERKIAAALTRVEPFESKGYVLVEHPINETEFNQLIDNGAIPEIVVHMKLSVELFVSRRIDAEVTKRDAEYNKQLAEVKAKKAEIMKKTREIELLKWRRRNIGADDDPAEELDEIPEEPEAIPLDQTKSDLETSYDELSGNVDAVLSMFPDKRIPVVPVNGDAGKEAVISSTFDLLAPNLSRRRSLLEAPQIISFDEATQRLLSGSHILSSFRFTDPVTLAEQRAGAPPQLVRVNDGENIPMENALPEIPPPEPKKKETRIVEKEDEEGNIIEVEEEVEDEEETSPPEEEEEVELEAEPDLGPEELEEMQKEFEEKQKKLADTKALRAVILRNRIYFIRNEANLLKFMQNPLHYWDQAPPLDQVDRTVICVMENQPDEAAESEEVTALPRNLAHHLAANLRFHYVDIPKLVKWVLRKRSNLPILYSAAKKHLFNDEPLSNDWVANAISARLNSVDVQSSGAVIHNLPRNWKQFMTMTSLNILINKVYIVDDFIEEDLKVIPMIEGVARVVEKVSQPATTECLMECYSRASLNVERRQTLNLRRKYGFPARIDGASVSEAQIEGSLSVFQWYCPNMWSHENQLVDMREERTHVAEYCGEVYCFSTGQSLTDFMVNPERFSGEVSKLQELPTMLPSHIEASQIDKDKLEFCGCCPVTLYETRNHRGLKGITEPTAILGSPDLTVEYDQKYYSPVDERAMTLFLRQPWVYTKGATLPLAHKLPFDNEKWKTLSAEHFITKALYEQVAGALLEVAKTRPKFPGLSIEGSARKFVALHLKAHNQKNTEHRQECYQKNFEEFEERATLYKTITTTAPEDPNELALFDHRCKVWDDVQDDQECYKAYAELK